MLSQLLLPALVIQVTRVTWPRHSRLNRPIHLLRLSPLSSKEGNSTLSLNLLLVTKLLTNTLDPPHSAELIHDKFSIDPESAPFCGSSDSKDPANDAEPAFHLHIQLGTS
ncbi:hypothetical protein STEG23_035581 [Scotinomys teguina]